LSCKNIFFTIINLLYMFHLMLVLNEYKQNNPEYRSGVIYIFHSSPRFTVSATINFFGWWRVIVDLSTAIIWQENHGDSPRFVPANHGENLPVI
jgi:hypothetical protein